VGALRGAAGVFAWFDGEGVLREEEEEEEEVGGGGGGVVGGADGSNKASTATTMMPGLGVKRRYWFESMGVPIGNLIVL
jgi:hypothetical protein